MSQELIESLNLPTEVNLSGITKDGSVYYYAGTSVLFSGVIQETYPNGKLKLKFDYQDGDLTLQKWYFGNGFLAEKANFKTGEFKIYHENGNLRYDSEKKISQSDNDKDVYHYYVQTEKDGWYKEYYENGKISKQYNKICVDYSCNLDSSYKEWFDNGKLKGEGNYINGKKEGIWKEWFDNGKLKGEGNYINGKKEGIWKGWHENGQLELQANYMNGKLEGLYRRWGENGKLNNSTKYRNGVRY